MITTYAPDGTVEGEVPSVVVQCLNPSCRNAGFPIEVPAGADQIICGPCAGPVQVVDS